MGKKYKPFRNWFRILGFLISLIGLFYVNLPQSEWIILPSIAQIFYTLRALRNGPHNDIFHEIKNPSLIRLLIIGIIGFVYFANIYAGFAIISSIFKYKLLVGLWMLFGLGCSFYLVSVTFDPRSGSNYIKDI
tara:strand:- start:777 stop:1175 length:399 start_codon:yes stop_codon:yes gene_type:complete